MSDNQGPLWEVFIQTKPGLPHKHAGSLHAYDADMALKNARDLYTRRAEGTAIWVVLSENIHAIQEEGNSDHFEPATDKIYRHPTFYELPEGIKHM
jgi:ring-1,2-phenylacetyl-CoA epoxidase subunit PaaB